ncbi:MAG: efflux RND transporter periplasmic adaptor subunit [Gammaproteobacteria bacterium]|nr:efflux RND transporter periplasmic adaptor subunit [Gammaproteobacteria bacterium]
MAGIVVEALRERDLAAEIQAPGEVRLNAYRTTKVTSRITAQVIKRHVTLGERVNSKQVLVTLSSVEMADAQGALMVADREWQRVQKLGAKVISDRRYTGARVAHQLAYAKVAAFGMTRQEISNLLKSADASKANGEFQLLASRAGTVVQDDFIEGAVIEPGYVLMILSDESSLWIEARLTPQQLSQVNQGSIARIQTADGWLTGKITQLHHNLDEDTRTIAARITVANPDDRLHPGEFVEVRLQSSRHQSALAIPETAVVRSPDGDWQIMVEQDKPGEFNGVEVEVKTIINGMAVIEGVPVGTRVVTQGAFFVQSELAKSGFSVHNH